ncbi:hypothetical protein [Sneathiella aquimaris]|uniref:hypothetical protein n=1 Tax=Sneathiella aquimaris TaxID=2599305 RepID=UPI00146A705E|nr:hypothetical protein [Sneathiella aquimaris]
MVLKRKRLLAGGFILCLLMADAPATSFAQNTLWLPPGSNTSSEDASVGEITKKTVQFKGPALLGRLLFRSPSLLGEKAVRIGLSCNSCHPAGHVNTGFYISGLSNRPGHIDVTHGFWNAASEDGIFNPRKIPTLRGIRDTAPYGTGPTLPDLHAFTRHVIVNEFAGPTPSRWSLDALVSYLLLLEKQTGTDMIVQSPFSPATDLVSLLEPPLHAGDKTAYTLIGDLIIEELGRQINEENRQGYTQLARAIKKMRPVSSGASLNERQARYQRLLSLSRQLDKP